MDSFGLRFIPEIVCPTRQSPIDSAPAAAGAVLFISELTRLQLLRVRSPKEAGDSSGSAEHGPTTTAFSQVAADLRSSYPLRQATSLLR